MFKKALLASLIFAVSAFLIPLHSHAAWYDSDWQYRVKITVPSTNVPSGQTDFPIYVELANMPNAFFQNVENDGVDIVVTQGDEITPLAHDLVSIDASAEKGELYFKANSLSNASNNDFYIYYGNESAVNSNNPGSVWSNYEAVWHFEENVSQTSFKGLGAATQAGVNDSDGSWAVLYGKDPINTDLNLAADEEIIGDRSTGNNAVGYWLFENDQAGDIKNEGGAIIGEYGLVKNVSNLNQTENFRNTYTDPIVVTTHNLESSTHNPAVVRMHSVGANSFDLYLQSPTGAGITPADVYYIVIEAGDHTLPGGIDLEANSVTTSKLAGASLGWGKFNQEQITPVNNYVQPVVLGQIMTTNDTDWQVFWNSGGSRWTAPGNNIYISRHVGEAPPLTTRDPETLGYIILEEGSGTTDSINWEAALGVDNVQGVSENPPYSYTTTFTGNGAPSLFFEDSTLNNNDAYLNDTITGQASGKVGRSVNIADEQKSRLPIQNMSYFGVNNINEIAVSFWMKTTDNQGGIISFDDARNFSVGLNEHQALAEDGRLSFNTASNNNGSQSLNSSSTVNDGNWHHVTVVFDASDGRDKRIYIDGNLNASTDQHTNGLGNLATRYGFIGDASQATFFNGTADDFLYYGDIDEMRVMNGVASEEWVSMTFANQDDNINFLDFGPQETNNLPPSEPTTPYVNHTSAQAGLGNPTDLTVNGDDNRKVYFSAIYEDPDAGDKATEARVQVSKDPTFLDLGDLYWDSGWNTIANVNQGDRSGDIEYGHFGNAALSDLGMNDGDETYYWRIAFKDAAGSEGSFSATQSFKLLDSPVDPSGLSATKNGNDFDLAWSDNSTNEETFELERSENKGVFTALAASPFAANTTATTDDNLQLNSSYEYRIRACNYAGCSNTVEAANTYYSDLNAPTNVSAVYVSDNEFEINFTNVAPIEGVKIERCTFSLTCDTLETNLNAPKDVPQTYNDTSVPGTNEEFLWRITVNDGGDTVFTDSPLEYTTPNTPSDLSATYVSDASIDLNWVDNSDFEDGFRIEVSQNGDPFEEITPGANTVGADVTTYTYMASSANNSYDFKIRGHVGATTTNAELFSGEIETLETVYTSPATVTDLNQDYVTDDQIELTWTDNANFETGYNLYVEDNAGVSNLETTLASDSTSYTYAKGNSEGNYKFIVEPVIAANAPYNPTDLGSPSTQTNEVYTSPTPGDLDFSVATATTLEWLVADNSNAEDGFYFYESDGITLIQDYAVSDLDTINEGNLTPNTFYERHLATYTNNPNTLNNTVAVSANSPLASGRTLANPPANVAWNETTPGEIKLTWEANSNPVGTQYFAENVTLGTDSGWMDSLEWSQTGLECGINYGFSVKARNDDGIETEVTTGTNYHFDCPQQEESDTPPTSSNGGGGGHTPEFIAIMMEVEKKQEEKCPVPFPDVKGHPYETAITGLHEAGIIDGFDDCTFRADEEVDRIQILKMVLNTFDYDLPEQVILSSNTKPFWDAPTNEWFSVFLYYAVEQNIVTGYGDNRFQPNQGVTQAEAWTIALRASGFPIKIADAGEIWYTPYLEEGQLRGTFETFENPDQKMTRGEVAGFLWPIYQARKAGEAEVMRWELD